MTNEDWHVAAKNILDWNAQLAELAKPLVEAVEERGAGAVVIVQVVIPADYPDAPRPVSTFRIAYVREETP